MFKTIALVRGGGDPSDTRAKKTKRAEVIRLLRDMVEEDRDVTMHENQVPLGLSLGAVFKSFHEDLGLSERLQNGYPHVSHLNKMTKASSVQWSSWGPTKNG